MKTNLCLSYCAAALCVLALNFTPATAAVLVPPTSSLSLSAGNGSGTVSLSISNSGDQVWIIQSSSNLVDWTELESWKIHNGSYHRSLGFMNKHVERYLLGIE